MTNTRPCTCRQKRASCDGNRCTYPETLPPLNASRMAGWILFCPVGGWIGGWLVPWQVLRMHAIFDHEDPVRMIDILLLRTSRIKVGG